MEINMNEPIEELENGKNVSTITLEVARPFKNTEGESERDLIPVVIWNRVAEGVTDYCKKGDIVGIKGRIEGLEGKSPRIIAERFTFLTSSKKENENE